MEIEPFECDLNDDPAAVVAETFTNRTPADVEAQVMRINAASSVDDLAAALDAAEWLLCRAHTIDGLMKAVAIKWIDRHGAFDVGPIHYSVGYTTGVKCVDVPQAAKAVLTAVGGDLDGFVGTLVSQPFKHGTVRSCVEQEIYDLLFSTYRTAKLVSGVPERTLKRADKQFLKPSRAR